MKTPIGVVFALAVCCRAGLLWAIDVPLEQKEATAESAAWMAGSGENVWLESEKPKGKWTLPEFVMDPPLYGLLGLGGERCLVVLDKEKENDKVPSVLRIDLNGNADLTDDPVLKPDKVDEGSMTEFTYPVAAFTVKGDDGERTVKFRPSGSYMKTPLALRLIGGLMGVSTSFAYVDFESTSYLQGDFECAGKQYRVRAVDQDGDGTIGGLAGLSDSSIKRGEPHYNGDKFYLSEGEGEGNASLAGLPVAPWLAVGEHLFQSEIVKDGMVLRLTPQEEGVATVANKATFLGMTLYHQSRKEMVGVYGAGDVLRLPEGDFELVGYTLRKKDEHGNTWEAEGTGKWGKTVFTASAEEPGEISFGEPFVARVVLERVRKGWFGGTSAILSYEMTGNGGALIDGVDKVATAEGKEARSTYTRPKAPAYKVIAPDGEVVTQGRFEYG